MKLWISVLLLKLNKKFSCILIYYYFDLRRKDYVA